MTSASKSNTMEIQDVFKKMDIKDFMKIMGCWQDFTPFHGNTLLKYHFYFEEKL